MGTIARAVSWSDVVVYVYSDPQRTVCVKHSGSGA